MKTFVDFVTAIIRAIFEFLHLGYSMTEPPPRDPTLKAEFDPEQQTLSIYNEGFCVDGKRSLSLKDSFRHAVIVGKSGIGKSTSTFIPSLLTMHTSGSSLVIHDPSDELRKVCAGHLKQQGYKVLVLDFSNADRSIGFNPLAKIKDASDVNKIASMLVRTSLKQKDPFWDGSAEQLVKMAISLTLKMQEEYRNLANVLRIIKLMGADPKKVDTLMAEYADDSLFVDYKAFLANDTKVVSGVIATATTALSIFTDENVALVTSEDTFDFGSLRKKRIALFIQNKISDQQYYNVLISLWFELLFRSLMDKQPKPGEKSIYLLIDEAASGLRMPSLSNTIANLRKYSVGILLGLQSVEQLKETYGENDATTILSNCFLQMYFSGQSHGTAKMLSEVLGRYNYEDEKGNANLIRNLMEANEIRMMSKNNAIVLVGSEKPILANLAPYYERWWLRMRADIKPPMTIGVGIGKKIEYIG
jgi:type IV secretion system protein VirD4